MNEAQKQLLLQRLAKSRDIELSAQPSDEARGINRKSTIPHANKNTALPLSHAQERMWFLHQLDPNSSAYNVCVLWHLNGHLNCEALHKSAIRISERHSIFRTLYKTDQAGNAYQHILSHLPPEWHYYDLSRQDNAEEQLKYLAQQASTEPFDLSIKSGLRLVLVALKEEQHVLIMIGQHIAWDGPSFGIFSQELAKGYELFLLTKEHKEKPKADNVSFPLQYVDFAYWHRQQWQKVTKAHNNALDFWQKQLSPLPEKLNFPTDLITNTNQDEAGSWHSITLDSTTTQALLNLCVTQQVTPFEILVTAIAILTTSLAGASEVTIGTVASHRNLSELQDVIGNFGNVIPLRLPINPQLSFCQQLQQSASVCRAAFSHAEIPFEHLLDHLNIPRGTTDNALLDTMVTFLSHGMKPPTMKGIEVEWQKHFNGTTQTDLSFDALLQDGCLHLQATWRTALFHEQTIPKHLERLALVLQQFATTPDSTIASTNLLLDGEYHQLVHVWGHRPAQLPRALNLVDWFEQVASTTPNAIAICQAGTEQQADKTLSFASLNQRANRLARWLIEQKVGPEVRVAICLPRENEWFVTMLGILKAGAAFVPIDPNYPSDYIHRVISLAQPKISFVNKATKLALKNALSDNNQAINSATDSNKLIDIVVAEQEALHEKNSDNITNTERLTPLLPLHPSYIVFTSGSSGEPKGVVVPHSAIVNLLSSHNKDLYQTAYQQTKRQTLRIGHAWSLAFDASWQPILWMFEGHELHLFDMDTVQDPLALAQQIIERKLDFIELTPGMLGEVLPWLEEGIDLPDGSHLESHIPALLGFGGEPVKEALWQKLMNHPKTTGFNLYGPTETTVDTMIAQAKAGQTPSIGQPINGAAAYVLNQHMQLTPPGIAGELAIAGAGLARGYLGRGDLTACQFIANPYGEAGSRLYRTGDRVRWRIDGTMEYIGRVDEQIKIRGFRVEPLEVEVTIEQLIHLPCAVVAKEHQDKTQLICFFESPPLSDQAITALRQKCVAAMPNHLVPNYFVHLKQLPHLPNGKINRNALPIPTFTKNKHTQTPTTPLEKTLCKLFSDLLGGQTIGLEESFFELGGDSISVIRLVSLARREGLLLTAKQIFDTPTIARLADHIEQQTTTPEQTVKHDQNERGKATPTPLMQQYLNSQITLDGFAQLVRIPLPDDVSYDVAQILLKSVLQRHAILNSKLTLCEHGEYCLDIPSEATTCLLPPSQFGCYRLQDVNQSALNASQKCNYQAASAQEIANLLCKKLAPHNGIMVAAAYVKEEKTPLNVLWLAVNHLVIDASSWHVLAGDLALAYEQHKQAKSIHLPPVPTAWRNWANTLDQPSTQEPISAAEQHLPKLRATGNKPHLRLRTTLANSVKVSRIFHTPNASCPVETLAKDMGVTVTSLLPVLLAITAIQTDSMPKAIAQKSLLQIEQHGRIPQTEQQDLSRTIGWFAHETSVPLAGLDILAGNQLKQKLGDKSDKQTIRKWHDHIRYWCWQVERHTLRSTTKTEPATASITTHAPTPDWCLGFNFLGELTATTNTTQAWQPTPCLALIPLACGDCWPLFHDLNVNAYYAIEQGKRQLHMDILAPAENLEKQHLILFFEQLQQLIQHLTYEPNDLSSRLPEPLLTKDIAIKTATPLQTEMLHQSQKRHDPWTTQMELLLAAPPHTPNQPDALTETAFFARITTLLARHQVLRSGFIPDNQQTFIAKNLAPDWQYEDWRNLPTNKQKKQLNEFRKTWHLHRFDLAKPPLIRFLFIRLNQQQGTLFIHCHHLLLDGWSVPRLLHELLTDTTTLQQTPLLSWGNYLDWLAQQEQSLAWRYWNTELDDLVAPSVIASVLPSIEHAQVISNQSIQTIVPDSENTACKLTAQKNSLPSAAFFQFAWAHTLADILKQKDIVFGLFDAGRAMPINDIESLIGLTLHHVPIRINTAEKSKIITQLKTLQTKKFEWQTLPPIALKNLAASYQHGEIFDTLLVIENGLQGDFEITEQQAHTRSSKALSILEQSWQDSVAQTLALFIYPSDKLTLRLCYAPQYFTPEQANQILTQFQHHLHKIVLAVSEDTTSQKITAPSSHKLASQTKETKEIQL